MADTELIFYPPYESWDKSVAIDETVSDTLTLLNDGSAMTLVKVIFETFTLDPDLGTPDSGFVRFWVDSATITDEGICITADYHHTRPITAEDWAATTAGDAIVGFPTATVVAAVGGIIDIPLTGFAGIRTCPTGIRFALDASEVPGGIASGTNSIALQGFSTNPPELHLTWAEAAGGGDTGGNATDPDADDRAGERPADRDDRDSRDPRTPRHQRPREIGEYAIYAATLLAAKQRPIINYAGKLRKGDED